jgi:hypothetical protein
MPPRSSHADRGACNALSSGFRTALASRIGAAGGPTLAPKLLAAAAVAGIPAGLLLGTTKWLSLVIIVVVARCI